MNREKKLIIIDSNSVVHRAFHALPPLTTKNGELINAVYGFLLVFLKVVSQFQPDYLAATFDLPGPTFRHQKFKEYKIKRPPTPEGIKEQLPKLKEILTFFNIPIFEKPGFEADDIIATIVSQVIKKSKDLEIIILTGDTDSLCLVNPQTAVYLLKKGVKDVILYNQEKIKEKYQLSPEQLVDFKALKGDPTDNVPGIAGIGEKTALKLIKEFGSLENLYNKIESETNLSLDKKLLEKLRENKEKAFLSKSLVELENNVDIEFDLNQCLWKKFDKEKAIEVLKKYQFNSLIEKIKNIGFEKKIEKEIKTKTLF